jgi:hypothetical protein
MGTRLSNCNVATLGVPIILEWDPVKDLSNIKKHGFDFADAEEPFALCSS